ncbi:MAG: TetR/AcrR family transcriptional regulator [Candidatus Omnitrophica bacterium]|nr:TetR/AcrR family transcriptional regulator [Candidatus Omnitrophota bacterium]
MITLTRKERDRQLRKSDILRAAERIFSLKGFHEATMCDIAKEAQYATGTVYLYFKDKDLLYFSLVEEKIKCLIAAVKEDTESVDDAESKIKIFIARQLDFFEKNQDFFGIFLSERSKFQTVREEKFSKPSVLLQYREFTVYLIKTGQAQGIITDNYGSKQIAEIFFSIIMSVVFDWFKNTPKAGSALSGLSEFIFDIFVNGVGKNK